MKASSAKVLWLRLEAATRASLFHLIVSIGFAGLVAWLVFRAWYPWPLYKIQGGLELFWLIVCVDVVCGPLLTFIAWNPMKPKRELTQDMSIVAALQLAALVYGLHTIAAVRPVFVVYEADRMRIVSATEFDHSQLPTASEEFRHLPWNGPKFISVREPRNSDELLKSIEESLAGREPSLRPDWWQPYSNALPEILKRAMPLETLIIARPEKKALIESAISKSGLSKSDLMWLPLTSAKTMEWIILIDNSKGLPQGFVEVDGFL